MLIVYYYCAIHMNDNGGFSIIEDEIELNGIELIENKERNDSNEF